MQMRCIHTLQHYNGSREMRFKKAGMPVAHSCHSLQSSVPLMHNHMKFIQKSASTTADVSCSLMFVSVSSCSTAERSWIIDAKHSRAKFQVTHAFIDDFRSPNTSVSDEVHFFIVGKIVQVVRAAFEQVNESWFNVASYKTWYFTSKKIRNDLGRKHIDGDLTLNGMNIPISFVAQKLVTEDRKKHYHATAIVDRFIFGMQLSKPEELTGDKVCIELDIVLHSGK